MERRKIMIKVIVTEKIPIKMWVENLEESALEQAKNLANLPFAFKHIALMPDCHSGYGMPIGGVLATDKIIIPNAVGVDIGCGMCSVATDIEEVSTEDLKKIMSLIRKTVPVGFEHHKENQDKGLMPESSFSLPIVDSQYASALKQIGTLGGGNHFIEIQKSSNGKIAIMIHSGSRNLGYRVAKYYNDKAKELNAKWFSNVPSNWGLAFLPIDTQEAHSYMAEMQYCIDFALANRELMLQRIKEAFVEVTDCRFSSTLNIAHNYATWENHFNKNVIVHRKGATRAREGELGIIPGSQGTASYIVEGLGNKDSFCSCSHGAGRLMGRKEAKRELNLNEEKAKLDTQGIIHSIRSIDDLDEASGAYKDIDTVMENQKDLVKIIQRMQPLAVIKG